MSAFSKSIFVASILITAISGTIAAQASTVTMVPGPAQAGIVPPTPSMPLEVQDTDYPLESLLANEEGTATINFSIDEQGRVAYSQRMEASSSLQLDRVAAQVAKARWRFQPATKDGMPVSSVVTVKVTWTLPLRPADDNYSQMMGFPVDGKTIVLPKPIPATRKTSVSDYPVQSVRNLEQGEVALTVQVLENGRIGDVRILDGSGYSRLDQAANKLVKERFAYEPGTVDGKPTQLQMDINVIYMFTGTNVDGQRFCHSRPILGDTMTMTSDGSQNGISIREWIHVIENGTVDDVLIETRTGWMHFNEPLVQAASAAANNSPVTPARRTTVWGGLATTFMPQSRPVSCWYKGNMTVGAKK